MHHITSQFYHSLCQPARSESQTRHNSYRRGTLSLTAVEVSQFNLLQLLPSQLSWPCTRGGTNKGRLQRSKVLHPGGAAVTLQSIPSQTPVHRWLAVLNKSDARSNNCELLFICCMRIRPLASLPGSRFSISLLAVWKIDSVCN